MAKPKVSVQTQLDADEHAALVILAYTRGVSVAALLRMLVRLAAGLPT